MADSEILAQDGILRFLCSHTKLERDRGLAALEQKLKEPAGLFADEEALGGLQSSLLDLVKSSDKGWETKQGGLLGTKLVILDGKCSDNFCETARNAALGLLHDDEARVRLASGKGYKGISGFILNFF